MKQYGGIHVQETMFFSTKYSTILIETIRFFHLTTIIRFSGHIDFSKWSGAHLMVLKFCSCLVLDVRGFIHEK